MVTASGADDREALAVAHRIIALLPLDDDGTGHVADCGYTEMVPVCGCYSLPGRIAPLLARVKREAAAEGAVQVLRETADRLDAFRFPTGSDALEPMFRLVASLRARADRLEGATDADH